MPAPAPASRPPSRAGKQPARRPAAARRSSRRSGIRWDRVGRFALLVVLGVVLLLYIPPVTHWVTQKRTASEHRSQLEELRRENARLKSRVSALRQPDALEREARRLGMVKAGERAYSVEHSAR